MAETVALIGAGGKMGTRLLRNLRGRAEYRLLCCETGEAGQGRLAEARQLKGAYTEVDAAVDFEGRLHGIDTEALLELSYMDKKRMHNLKYFTWVEQQGKTVEELNAQWYDESYWKNHYSRVNEWDERIKAFNAETGLLKEYQ